MKVLPKTSVYGLLALMYISSHRKPGEYMSIKSISEELDISFHFLTKILQSLTEQGLLESYRGPRGGIALKKPPDEIYLIDIIKILEGEQFFDSCLLGLPGCGEADPCPVHDFWKDVKAELKAELESASLSECGSRISKERLRLRG